MTDLHLKQSHVPQRHTTQHANPQEFALLRIDAVTNKDDLSIRDEYAPTKDTHNHIKVCD